MLAVHALDIKEGNAVDLNAAPFSEGYSHYGAAAASKYILSSAE